MFHCRGREVRPGTPKVCTCARTCACERVCSPASQMFPIFNSPFAPLDLQESVRLCRIGLPLYQRALPHYLFVSLRRFTRPLMNTFPERGDAGFALFHCRHPSCQSSDPKCFQSVLLSRHLSALFSFLFFLVFLLCYCTAELETFLFFLTFFKFRLREEQKRI